jgi:hypothetical protein
MESGFGEKSRSTNCMDLRSKGAAPDIRQVVALRYECLIADSSAYSRLALLSSSRRSCTCVNRPLPKPNSAAKEDSLMSRISPRRACGRCGLWRRQQIADRRPLHRAGLRRVQNPAQKGRGENMRRRCRGRPPSPDTIQSSGVPRIHPERKLNINPNAKCLAPCSGPRLPVVSSSCLGRLVWRIRPMPTRLI